MKFSRYIKDKINYILGFIVYCMIIIAYTRAMQVDKDISIVIITISLIFFVCRNCYKLLEEKQVYKKY